MEPFQPPASSPGARSRSALSAAFALAVGLGLTAPPPAQGQRWRPAPSASASVSASASSSAAAPPAPTASAAPAEARGPALAVLAQVVLRVEALRGATDRVTVAAKAHGGSVVTLQEGHLTVEVPLAERKPFFEALAALGELQSETLTSEDLTDALGEAGSRVSAARLALRRMDSIATRGKGVPDGLVVERAREAASRDLAAAEAEERSIRHRAGVLRVEVRLTAQARDTVPSQVRMPFPWLSELGLGRLQGSLAPAPEEPDDDRSIDEVGEGMGGFRFEAPHRRGTRFGAEATNLSVGGRARALEENLMVGLDLWLGGGGGFAYQLQSRFGVGFGAGRWFALMLSAGPGFDGITGAIPLSVTFPLEAMVTLDVVEPFGLTLWAQEGWVTAGRRLDGAPDALFGDEGAAGLELNLGSRDAWDSSHDRNGPSIGVGMRQVMGVTLWQATLGWSGYDAGFD